MLGSVGLIVGDIQVTMKKRTILMVQMGKQQEGDRTMSHGHGYHHLGPCTGVRTDSCLGARTEAVGGQWLCGNRTRK